MKNIKLNKWLGYLSFSFLLLTLTIYLFYRLKNNFLSINGVGDEYGFVKNFNYFIINGYEKANIYGHSILFNTLAYPFYLITRNQLLSLKVVSLLSSLLTIGIIYRIAKDFFELKNVLLYGFLAIVLNVLVVSSFMFFAYDDNLLFPFLFMFIYQYLKIKKNSSSIYSFAIYSGVLLSLFISIRAMTIIYIPFIVILLIDVFRSSITIYKSILLFLICVVTPLVFLNLPSILNKGTLSYHDKGNPAKDVNWSQLQYLSALKKDNGMMTKDYHVSLDEVREYLRINGENSLPKKISESIFFDIKITIKEFFKDFLGLLKPFVRLTGILFTGILFFARKEKIYNLLFLFALGFMALLSFIIISYVETRWVIGPFILVIMYIFANFKSIEFKKIQLLLSINMLLLAMFNIPFILKNLINW